MEHFETLLGRVLWDDSNMNALVLCMGQAAASVMAELKWCS